MRPTRWTMCLSVLLVISLPAFAKDSHLCNAYGPLVRDALRLLPEEHRFPCDPQHLVVVRNLKDFTSTLPESERAEATTTLNQPWVWAFVSRRQFPIYLLQMGEQGRIADNYALGQTPWFRYFMACVLVHEHSHIAYQGGEAIAYRKELDCINQFKAEKQIPAQFPTAELEQAIQSDENSPRIAESSNEPGTQSATVVGVQELHARIMQKHP